MMQGVWFGNIHSFYDLNLILAPFTPTPATPKTTFIDVAGGDGSLDLTEAHGKVNYNDRTFQFVFTIDQSEEKTFDEKVTQISNALNGQRFKITLDRDPDYYWDGRCSVDQYKQDGIIGQITVKAIVKPYKLKQKETVVTVDLTDGYLTQVNLQNARKQVCPVIECSADNTNLVSAEFTVTMNAGVHKYLDFVLREGENLVSVQNSNGATVTFTYQEGDL